MTRNRSVVGLPVAVVALCVPALVLAVASLGFPALAHAAEEGGGSLIEVNWTLGVQLISFLLLLAVLHKLLYRPLIGRARRAERGHRAAARRGAGRARDGAA